MVPGQARETRFNEWQIELEGHAPVSVSWGPVFARPSHESPTLRGLHYLETPMQFLFGYDLLPHEGLEYTTPKSTYIGVSR